MAAIGKRRESKIGSNIEKMKGLKVTDLLVPGLFILVFVLLTFFVYIPSLTESNEMRLELSEVRSDIALLERNLAAIEPLVSNKAQLNTDLVKTENIIPKNLEVSDFSYFVNKIAIDSGLKFEEIVQQNSLNQNFNSTRSKLQLDSTVSSVKGPITYSGTYEQIVLFLDRLQKDSPYIIEVVQLDLGRSDRDEDEDEEDEVEETPNNDDRSNEESDDTNPLSEGEDYWTIQLSISGYFISQESEVNTATIYQNMIPYTDSEDVLEVFEYKARILEESGDQSTPDDRDEGVERDEDFEVQTDFEVNDQ